MKNLYHKKSLILLSIGVLTIATSQIFTHYLKISDLMQGLSFGVGIGLLIMAIANSNLKAKKVGE
ncbi:hypothetical protein [Tenacibaculum singaporense]|uniref:hypothetical protein n=1 Tax=Tenacibaculum singaporense TaxID=2358479 RepID=UPI000F66E68C|nr:hypothetical protein [Tenacibaculum singaporense]RSC92295.1 hypothetical protein EI424_14770 [Tenacibaculum singaporense]